MTMTHTQSHSPRSNYRPQHLAHMEKRGVMPLDLLSPEAQRAAIENIRATDRAHLSMAIASARKSIKHDLHGTINSTHLIPSLARRAKHVRRVELDEDYCRHYILANLCEFTPDGQYKTLMVTAVNVASAPPSTTHYNS